MLEREREGGGEGRRGGGESEREKRWDALFTVDLI